MYVYTCVSYTVVRSPRTSRKNNVGLDRSAGAGFFPRALCILIFSFRVECSVSCRSGDGFGRWFVVGLVKCVIDGYRLACSTIARGGIEVMRIGVVMFWWMIVMHTGEEYLSGEN